MRWRAADLRRRRRAEAASGEAARVLAESLRLASASDRAGAAAGLERLIGEHGEALLVRLLSDGSAADGRAGE